MRVVVADTSPLRYLVLIAEAGVLGQLYERVLVPNSVAIELNQSRTPAIVREWILSPPPFIEIVPVRSATASIIADLDEGERDAISLALELRADLVLMDDREGVRGKTPRIDRHRNAGR